jgi:hypothetical protein
MNVQEYLRTFIAKANAKYPELVKPDEFADLLATLYGSARLILSETSFNRWIHEKSEVELFLARRIYLKRHDIHVQGTPLGHYKIMIYENDNGYYEYVEIEWIGHGGNLATNQKVFKIEKNLEVPPPPPLGEVISTMLSLGGF